MDDRGDQQVRLHAGFYPEAYYQGEYPDPDLPDPLPDPNINNDDDPEIPNINNDDDPEIIVIPQPVNYYSYRFQVNLHPRRFPPESRIFNISNVNLFAAAKASFRSDLFDADPK